MMMRIDAIVVPRGAEAGAVERGWTAPRPPMLLVPAGAGAGRRLNDGRPIQTALVLGLCGALDPVLRIGEPVVYASIVDGSQTIELDPKLAAVCAAKLHTAPRRAANVGAFVGSASRKHALYASTGAAAIDMEATSIARALHARAVNVVMVRVVSDDAVSELPDLTGVYDEDGEMRPVVLALALARTPVRSIRFIANALTALHSLRATAALLAS